MTQQQYQVQDNSYPQQNSIPMPKPANVYNSPDDNILRLQIDVEDALIKFEYEVLRGQYLRFDETTYKKEWVEISPGSKPPVNDVGVREIMGRIRGRAHVVARLTYKEESECYTDLFQFHMSLAEMFARRSDAWDMDEEVAKPILDAALELVEDIVFSARNGFTAINLRTQYSETRLGREGAAAMQKTFMGIPIGGGK